MGVKGDKMKQESVQSAELLVEKLSAIGNITSKKMFGGHGIFHDGNMFSIIDSSGTAFLKSDAETSADFEALGAAKHGKMPYYAIPEKVLADGEELVSWARKSIGIGK